MEQPHYGDCLSRRKWAIKDHSNPDGTYQGFTIFADAVSRDSLWRTVIAELHEEGFARPASMTLVYMDDTVISLILPSATHDDQSVNEAYMTNMRRTLTEKMKAMFGLQTDVTKSLIGKEKFVYLNASLQSAVCARHPSPSS
eukprot:4193469-Amphidinium_carterae.1